MRWVSAKEEPTVQDQRTLIQRLNLRGNPLSKGHRRIADFIAQNYDKAVFMTAATLGTACGVSESTVVRFATAMGYDGYPELRERLASLVRQQLTSEQRFAIASTLRERDVLSTVLHNDEQNIRKTMEAMAKYGVRDKIIVHCKEAGFCYDVKTGEFTASPSLNIPKEAIKGSVGADGAR
jgi:hypothetical protein